MLAVINAYGGVSLLSYDNIINKVTFHIPLLLYFLPGNFLEQQFIVELSDSDWKCYNLTWEI